MLAVFSLLRRLRHGMTVGVRVLAFDDAGRILLVRHTYVEGWHLPGGGVDLGESAEAAARRELREEANVEADGPLVTAGVFFNPRVGGRDHVVLFRATRLRVGPRPQPGVEIRAADFFALDALPEGLSGATRRRLAERDGAPASDRW